MSGTVAVAPAELAARVRELFTRQGMPRADAELVADALVWAEMRGMDTHGVMRARRSNSSWTGRRSIRSASPSMGTASAQQ